MQSDNFFEKNLPQKLKNASQSVPDLLKGFDTPTTNDLNNQELKPLMSVFLNHSQILNSVIASQKRMENQYMPMIKTLKTSALLDMSRFDAVIGAATTSMLRDMAKVTPMIETARNAALRDMVKVAPIIEVAKSTALHDIARMTPIIDMAKKSFDISRVFSNLGQVGMLSLGDIGKIVRFPSPMTESFMGALIKTLESWKNFEIYPDRVDDWEALFGCLDEIKSIKDIKQAKKRIIECFSIKKFFFMSKARSLFLPGSALLQEEDLEQDFLESFYYAHEKTCKMTYRQMVEVKTDVFVWFRSQMGKYFRKQINLKGESKRALTASFDCNSHDFYERLEQLTVPDFDRNEALKVFEEVGLEAIGRLAKLSSESSHNQIEMIQRLLAGEISLSDLSKEYHPNHVHAMKKQLRQADQRLDGRMTLLLRSPDEYWALGV
jgi:hypothetical protein